ncbi:glycosyl hydrolase family 81-domain-containing protein [Thamnocephalis sphaerospora]|uniref:glucan endo-1,3-beta-D-glucosidase n=1 Tax=Thamnocephalis sphaerospora TaxID=78915 RepID=A0A4P9XLL4_9FUNG|nr:glycosyl hydrolase family 81-domain-containing protein [Thamnocephalis sphaerospora]|eukprot:RKP06160.1 glycosyl hydrolase family 81-domain-containing protein [Thamnocephalis sphaerospora]
MLDYAPLVNWHANFDPAMLAKNRLAELCEAVDLDMKRAITPTSGDPGVFGKEMVRLAMLVLIAEHIGLSNRVDTVLDRMAEGLHPWLDPNSPTSFRYDITNGGLLTMLGAHDLLHRHDDHAYYHNHHIHHGYFVHAAAALARHRPDWWTAHRSAVLSICMDYFYMSSDRATSRNPFPRLRHFDPYDGHSWSNGTRVHPDGRSHIYSSRSVNAYYAVALLAEVDGWEELGVAARVVLGMELRASRTYWQMAPPAAHPAIPNDGLRYAADVIAAYTVRDRVESSHSIIPWKKYSSESVVATGEGRDQDELYGQPVIYPSPFRQRGAVGTLWSSKADYNTRLENRPEHTYTVQFLPFTPITHALLDSCWLQRIWPILHHAIQRDNPCNVQRRGLILMAGAFRGNTAAIGEAWCALSKMPSGRKPNDEWEHCNSKGNALYWVAANAAMLSRR